MPLTILANQDANDFDQVRCLDAIEALRDLGIGTVLDLPELVVCGDQSSGKSSVLEAISQIPFPTDDGLCTRFATELVLRRGPTESLKASIIPGPQRNAEEARILRAFKIIDMQPHQIHQIIQKASGAMKVGGRNDPFYDDTLRIQVTAPNLLNLTVVDLPGLFHSGDSDQTSRDADLVRTLVDRYITRKRTIILAIISARYEMVNQAILRYAREVDKDGRRTLGIVTKPDTLRDTPKSAEKYFKIINNETAPLELGWHVLKNRSFGERHCSTEERDKSESSFFEEQPWKNLDSNLKGIDSLRPRLSDLLFMHIKTVIPRLIEEGRQVHLKIHDELSKLGPQPEDGNQALQLYTIGRGFISQLSAALTGRNSRDEALKLQRIIKSHIAAFEVDILHTYPPVVDMADEPGHMQTDSAPERLLSTVEAEVEQRGGIVGQFDSGLASELFYEHTDAWPSLVSKFVTDLLNAVRDFSRSCLRLLKQSPEVADKILKLIIEPALHHMSADIDTEAKRITGGHRDRRPVTFPQVVTENILTARGRSIRRLLRARIAMLEVTTGRAPRTPGAKCTFNTQDLLDGLEADLRESIYRLSAYEVVVCTRAHCEREAQKLTGYLDFENMESCIGRHIAEAFEYDAVNALPPERLREIFGRDDQTREKREALVHRTSVVQNALAILEEIGEEVRVGEPSRKHRRTEDEDEDWGANTNKNGRT